MAKNKRGIRGARGARVCAAASYAAYSGHGSAVGTLDDCLPSGHGNSDFTMRDEARNTSKSHTDWDRATKLRARPVAFVTGGLIAALDDPIDQGAVGTNADVFEGQPGFIEMTVERSLTERNTPPSSEGRPAASDGGLSTGGAQGDVGGTALHVEELSDSPSDSSQEVIVFQGRGRHGAPSSRLDFTLREMRLEIDAVDLSTPTSQMLGALESRENRDSKVSRRHLAGSDSEEDAILADYIANITDDDMLAPPRVQPLLRRDLGGSDDELRLGRESSDSTAPDQEARESSERVGDPSSDVDQRDARSMTDEQMACLLAKQEELGLGGEELLLFGDTGTGARETHEESEPLADTLADESGDSGALHPSASAVAIAAEEFDLMDWGRPSLRNKLGRRKGGPVFDVSDSELEAKLKTQTQKDRFKKREQRQARETLRTEGLLGKHAHSNDLRRKYPGGIMTLDDIKTQVRAFLLGSQDSLALPPMGANQRKVLHEVANWFKIKSKSTGSGDQRRPVLHRTRNTVKFAEPHFEQAMALMQRRNMQRSGRPFGSGPRGGAGGGRVDHAAVTVRDGEVVGGSAPEIGSANKGRRLLEKMGWSNGDALGAMDNKGRTEPIEHIVKRSKAGLG